MTMLLVKIFNCSDVNSTFPEILVKRPLNVYAFLGKRSNEDRNVIPQKA